MRRRWLITTVALGAAVAASDAEARLDLYVDKSTQQLSVIHNGSLIYVWPISTGRDKSSTPSGVYTPERLERSWFSKAYYNSPMPHAIFFHNGYAIHGSYDISKLGGPASHGCVRLHPRDAAVLYALVEREGPTKTAIFVGGDSNPSSLRYRNFDGPARPTYRYDDSIARGAPLGPAMLPREGANRYVDGTGAYPPPDPRMSPYYPDSNVDGRSAYPSAPDGGPYDDADRYAGQSRSVHRGPSAAPGYNGRPYVDARGAPPGRRVAPDYNVDPYVDARGAPLGPGIPPDHGVNPYLDARGAPPGPGVPSDYNVEPYSDGRGAPRGLNVPPYYDPDHRGEGQGAYMHGPSTPPYRSTDRYTGEPARRHGDQVTMRGNYPEPRLDVDAPAGRIPRNGSRPVTSGAKSKPGRLADEPPNRHVNVGEGVKAPPPPLPVPLPAAAPPPPAAPLPAAASLPWPAPLSTPPTKLDPPPEQQQSNIGYKVLPKSYWAGASWRWRIKRDEDGASHDSQ